MELERGAGAVTYKVAAFALFLALAAGMTALLHRPESLEVGDYPYYLPWWVAAIMFAVTDSSVVKVRWRRQTHSISLGEAPMVIGLFLATPGALLLGRLMGGLAGFGAYHRQPPIKAFFNIALGLAGTAAAQAVFIGVLGDARPMSARSVLAALLACAATGLVEALALIRLQAWFAGWPSRSDLPRLIVSSVLTPVVAGAAGVALVLAIGHGQAALPIAAGGAIVLIGYRAYGTLSDRHASLERLYQLSDALAAAPGSADVIRSVLSQSIDLLRAGYAELVLDGGSYGSGVHTWTLRAGHDVSGPVDGDAADGDAADGDAQQLSPESIAAGRLVITGTERDDEFLDSRNISAAVMVPLRIDGPITGHLVVGDRHTEEGPFRPGDVRLLETVANHASLALRNGQLIERLHVEARRDELTGLPNRLDFRERLEIAGARAASGEPCAVMVLDFNGFKAINDSLGHQAGDELLRVLARRFETAVIGRAMVARLGGDEFAVLVPDCPDATTAQSLAAAILATFEEQVPVGTARLRVGGSLGIALGPQHGTSGSELLRRADLAMYAAKAGSGGRRVYTPEMSAGSAEVLTLATDLREAVRADEISTVYHPVIDLASGSVHSVEVLARWTHPKLGEIAPAEFFAAAERSGQVAALSELVLHQALAVCASWREHGLSLRVAVNLAPRWLADPSLPDRVAAALNQHDVPAELLCLEITEHGVIGEPKRATDVLNRLRAMGIHLAIDDFGAGHSSLTHLSRLPVGQLKIDRSFIERLYDSGRDRAIVQTIIDLGRNLGLEVVAEGITDPGARRALQEMGCPLGQGYLFAKPVKPEELGPLLHRVGVLGWDADRPSTPTSIP